jgi:hypothetical protein
MFESEVYFLSIQTFSDSLFLELGLKIYIISGPSRTSQISRGWPWGRGWGGDITILKHFSPQIVGRVKKIPDIPFFSNFELMYIIC